jgi:hypothetical protein
VATGSLTATGHAAQVAPHVLSIAHWARLENGELYAPLSRLEWATLLKRTFSTDARVCPRCGGRMKVRAVVTDAASIGKLLAALRRPRAPPDVA